MRDSIGTYLDPLRTFLGRPWWLGAPLFALVFAVFAFPPAGAQNVRNAAPAALHIRVQVVSVLIPPVGSFYATAGSGAILWPMNGRGMDEIREVRPITSMDAGQSGPRIKDCMKGCIMKTRTIVAQ